MIRSFNAYGRSSQRLGEPCRIWLPVLAPFFGIPSKKAAEELSVGTTTLKRWCRPNGIKRWPYRKINAIKEFGADWKWAGRESRDHSKIRKRKEGN